MTVLLRAIFLTFLLSNSILAQKSPIRYGDIPLEDLKLTTYKNDTTAPAVILCDYGYSAIEVYNSTARLNLDRHIRIKILTKEGLDWANASIPIYHVGSQEERVTNLKATTYNLENGRLVESSMTKSSVFKEKFNKFIDLQKFTLPNVKVGSVIEYSYTVSSEFVTRFPDWKFQHSIPCMHSEFWAMIPDFFEYNKFMTGYLPIHTYEVKPKNVPGFQAKGHHWIMKDLPAFRPEPFMTSEDDYMSRINLSISYYNPPARASVEIMGTWDKLRKDLIDDENFGGVLYGSNFLKKIADDVVAGKNGSMEKLEALHSYVKNTIEWDGTKDFLADNPKKVLELKKGTSGDINLLLGSLLQKAGFVVDMMLLSTRDHGFVREAIPMRKQLNYVICVVYLDNETILLDATEKFLPMHILPERCLNGRGLIISKVGKGWFEIQTKAKGRTVVNAELTLDNAGALNGRMKYQREGYDAFQFRKDYFAEGESNYKNSNARIWEIDKPEFENLKELQKPAIEIFGVTIPEHTTVAGDQIYLTPLVTGQLKLNPFKEDNRMYPVDFAKPSEQIYTCTIKIPDGYIIDELPKSKILALPSNAGRFIYNVANNGNTITITSSLQINKSLFIQDEYPYLKEFYNNVVAKQNEQVVIKKLR